MSLRLTLESKDFSGKDDFVIMHFCLKIRCTTGSSVHGYNEREAVIAEEGVEKSDYGVPTFDYFCFRTKSPELPIGTTQEVVSPSGHVTFPGSLVGGVRPV